MQLYGKDVQFETKQTLLDIIKFELLIMKMKYKIKNIYFDIDRVQRYERKK